MYQLFQDSMAICQFCQKPDIFLTMTANPQWPEVQEALLKFQVPVDENEVPPQDRDAPRQTQDRRQDNSDRPDIIA
jgi:hypothetical protein